MHSITPDAYRFPFPDDFPIPDDIPFPDNILNTSGNIGGCVPRYHETCQIGRICRCSDESPKAPRKSKQSRCVGIWLLKVASMSLATERDSLFIHDDDYSL